MHSKRLLFIVWPCVDWLFARRPRLLHLIYASSHTQCTTSVIPFIHLFRFTSTTSAMLFNYDATHRLHFMMSICILHSQTSLFVLFFFRLCFFRQCMQPTAHMCISQVWVMRIVVANHVSFPFVLRSSQIMKYCGRVFSSSHIFVVVSSSSSFHENFRFYCNANWH